MDIGGGFTLAVGGATGLLGLGESMARFSCVSRAGTYVLPSLALEKLCIRWAGEDGW